MENGQVIISAIPVLFDETTAIRPAGNETPYIEVGNQTTAHVILVDSDADELVNSLLTETLMVRASH